MISMTSNTRPAHAIALRPGVWVAPRPGAHPEAPEDVLSWRHDTAATERQAEIGDIVDLVAAAVPERLRPVWLRLAHGATEEDLAAETGEILGAVRLMAAMCRHAAQEVLGIEVIELDEPPDPDALVGHRACAACGQRIPEEEPTDGQLVLDGFAGPRGRGMPARYCSDECRTIARNGRRRRAAA